MPPKERPGYRKYRSVDLPAQSKARELTHLSSSRRVARPSFALEKAFGKSRPGNNISHIHAESRKPGIRGYQFLSNEISIDDSTYYTYDDIH